MVRTERLATTADRNGMLAEVHELRPKVLASDAEEYLRLQGVSRSVESNDVLEYWKICALLAEFYGRLRAQWREARQSH